VEPAAGALDELEELEELQAARAAVAQRAATVTASARRRAKRPALAGVALVGELSML